MKKFSIKKKAVKNLELPGEYALNECKITLLDFSKIKVINYKSIVEYGDKIIRLNTKEKLVKIQGESLNIENITDEEIEISGCILSFFFE